MNAAAFTVVLLLSMHPNTAKIEIEGQHWTKRACDKAKLSKPHQGRLDYHCVKVVVPEPKP